MGQRDRLIFLGCCLVALGAIGRITTGSYSFLYGDFWFTAGLLLLILLSIVDQPHFSKDANVFMNGVAGVVSLLPIPKTERSFFWWLFLSWSTYLVLSSYCIMLFRSKELKQEGAALKVFSRLNREIGRPEAIFSAYFLWGVFTQFSSNASAYRALFLFWAVFMILNLPQMSQHLSELVPKKQFAKAPLIGFLRSYSSPRTVECEMPATAPQLPPGSMARIRVRSGQIAAEGQVVDDRVLQGIRIVRFGVTSFSDAWSQIADASVKTPKKIEIEPLSDEGGADTIPTGVVDPGSSIGSLRVLVNPDADLVNGEILAVDLPKKRAFYQVVAATLREQQAEENQHVQSVEVMASQLGVWVGEMCRFEPVAWVAPAGGLVLKLQDSSDRMPVPEGQLEVGCVPNSPFPVHLNLNDIVTHNTAILGVTGSGKSYLAFWIISGLVQRGVKVFVLDVSRQHWVFLKSLTPTAIKTPDDVEAWYKSESKVGIHQFATSTNYPQTTAELVERLFKLLANSIKLKPGENEPAHVCIVFEEAHSLIPEWNQVAQRGDEAFVNRTARTVLQGRKYGLGCLLISQRTANVTKTILNQCNTIIGLQSFDQTGLDFLSNYMGTAYANVISTLPPRHAVLVGKASSSTRPILFQITDLKRHWAEIHNDIEHTAAVDAASVDLAAVAEDVAPPAEE